MAKVFGELITLLETDKRGMFVTLPQSRDSFCIPPNVYLLGTMNTADRSIKRLDAALRRRFAFVELMPNIDVLHGAKVGTLALDDFLEELNRRIAKTEGREKQIGHSFLMEGDEPISDPDEFARRLRQEILPLLQEYCYDDYGALASYIGAKLVDKEAQTLDHERLGDSDALLTALEDEFGRREAAEQGNAFAQHNLGVHYAEGRGVKQDDAQAVQWIRKAAEQGHTEAQFNLGWAYENGRGVPQDDIEAHRWMNLAAARTSGADQKRFADERDAVAKKMTPDQLAEAQKRAREWTEAFARRKP